METLIFEGTIKELKNHYTINEDLTEVFGLVSKPIMKKIARGVKREKPTGYRVYKTKYGMSRTWVFGDVEKNYQ